MSKLTPTSEQQLIIDTALTGVDIKIEARAGAAKSSTCMMVAEQLVKPSIYIAFNKAIAEEAATKFPGHVTCRTMHSIAYREIVTPKMRKKLQGFFNAGDVRKLPRYNRLQPEEAEDIVYSTIAIITNFCRSDSFDLPDFVSNTEVEEGVIIDIELILAYWEELKNEDSPTKITHDVYLKLYQLSKPVLQYRVIYIDEYQDTNPVVADIFMRQKGQKIAVGDTYQSIYEWRGAINALAYLPDTFTTLYLTESFRFTQGIADMATRLLNIVGNDRPVIGRGDIDKYNPDKASKAVIVRNNSSLLEILLTASDNGEKVYVLTNLKELWGKLYHIQAILGGYAPKFPDKELTQYKDRSELLEAANYQAELNKLINLTMQLSRGGLSTNINNIKNIIVSEENNASFALTTGHKSKGLEWDKVTLYHDLLPRELDEEGNEIELDDITFMEKLKQGQCLELLYVALTRARYEVVLPMKLKGILGDSGKDTRPKTSLRDKVSSIYETLLG